MQPYLRVTHIDLCGARTGPSVMRAGLGATRTRLGRAQTCLSVLRAHLRASQTGPRPVQIDLAAAQTRLGTTRIKLRLA